ncbi:hypothetical protein BDP67DRAFT_571801 [Colletotrichum lupini]|nr:hypothetical protein BDP67DRAFT_571801 [Colletotrichum lupini]
MATLSWDAEGAELRARTQVLRTYLKEGRYFVIAPDPAFLALGWVTWPFTLGAGPLFTETEYHRLPLPIPDLYPLNPAENSPMSHLIPKNGIIYLTLAHLALLYALGTHSDNPLTAPSPSRRVDQLVNWDSAVRSKCPDLEPFVTPSCTAI